MWITTKGTCVLVQCAKFTIKFLLCKHWKYDGAVNIVNFS